MTLEQYERISPRTSVSHGGANVGMYTIWAAVTRKACLAFEPEAQSYALLNQSILLNGVADTVAAYCMGLSDQTGLSALHLANMRAGSSCHSVGKALDFKLQPMKTQFRQGCFASRLDDLLVPRRRARVRSGHAALAAALRHPCPG